METRTIVRENWMTQRPLAGAGEVSVLLGFLLFISSYFFFEHILQADQWMPASGDMVFGHHQYWRAWTSLFAHGDLGHLISNAFLFLPFTYFLTSYFGVLFFPIVGILFGGLTNLIVLKTMPPEIQLIGISGVVYWMGAAYLTLYMLIDRRRELRHRFAVAFIISVVLFAPEAYKPEISYLSHLVGYVSGVLSGAGLYLINRKKYEAAEVTEIVIEDNRAMDLIL
jgi:rhomboid protease GluP